MNLDVHNSVHHWRFSTTGKVEIDWACILSSSTLTDISKSPEVLPAPFWGFLSKTEMDSNDSYTDCMWVGDVHEWTRTTDCKAHVVVTKHKAFKKVLSKGGHERSAPRVWNALDTNLNDETHIFEGVVFRVM